jgi:cytoskeleton protein RodZ
MTLQDGPITAGGAAAPEAAPGPSAGAQLRALREAAQMSADDVAQQLKLSRRQVLAIENDELDTLPGPTFVRGFIRNYARLMRVDPEPLLGASHAAIPSAEPMQPIARSMGELPQEDGAASNWTKWLIPAGLVIVLVGGIVVYEWTDMGAPTRRFRKEAPAESGVAPPSAGKQFAPITPPSLTGAGSAEPAPAPSSPPTVPAQTPPAGTAAAPPGAAVATPTEAARPAPASAMEPGSKAAATPAAAAPSAQTPAPQSPASPASARLPAPSPPALAQAAPTAAGKSDGGASGLGRLDFAVSGPSWVEVRDAKGEVLLSRTLSARTTQTVTGTPPLSVHLGNAGAVSLQYNGATVDLKRYARQEIARLTLPPRER